MRKSFRVIISWILGASITKPILRKCTAVLALRKWVQFTTIRFNPPPNLALWWKWFRKAWLINEYLLLGKLFKTISFSTMASRRKKKFLSKTYHKKSIKFITFLSKTTIIFDQIHITLFPWVKKTQCSMQRSHQSSLVNAQTLIRKIVISRYKENKRLIPHELTTAIKF